jgi:hypothetical protein
MDSYDDPKPRVRPTALTVICVLGIVFGVLGLLGGGIGLLSQLFSSQIQQAVTAGQTGTGPAAGAQTEILARTMEISKKYNPILIPLTIAKILVEGALLIGAIMTLGFKLTGKSMLAGALIAAAILESIQFIPRTMMQRDTSAALADLMPQIMAAQQGARGMPAGFDMSAMMNGIGTVTLVFGFFWLVAKIVLYVLGTKYLRRPDIEALFTSTSPEVR